MVHNPYKKSLLTSLILVNFLLSVLSKEYFVVDDVLEPDEKVLVGSSYDKFEYCVFKNEITLDEMCITT